MSAPTTLAYAVVLGSALGIGACLLASLMPRWGAPSLSRRLAPYLRDIADPVGISTFPSVAGIDPWWADVRRRFASMLGGDDTLARRLRRAGQPVDVPAFRGRQLIWAIGGAATGGLVGVSLIVAGRASPAGWVLPLVGAAAGVVACDAILNRAGRIRAARIEDELPTVLEFLALCLSAGEGILDSLRRVSAVGTGDLTRELRTAVLAVATGSSLSESLSAMSRELDIAAVSRAVDHVVSAIDRGAPVAHVLHAQALDAREEAKRGLIELSLIHI